jgi:preprotein translocase subunit SecF
MELIGRTRIDFIGKRYFAYALSAVLCGLGLAAFVAIGLGRANLGIEFAGGTAIQVRFERPIDLAPLRAMLGRVGLPEGDLQQFAEGDRVLIRVKRGAVGIGGVAERIREGLKQAFPDNRFVVEGSNEVGPAVGRDLQQAALLAIAISLVGIIGYIWVRFEFKFGIAATIATFHDVLTVLGVFFLLNKEITLLIVTALLTIAGYSLTDTVVIYDRIRENLRGMRREDLGTVMNVSINQVLSRTAMTSLTTLLASAALFLLGGVVLHDFALALILGIIVGSYSSWFVASPIVYEWRVRQRAVARAR